ncbi:MAG: glycosyltransferase family 2 protein [Bdellovibrionales bacterium]
MPVISVLIAVLNGEKTIRKSIESAQAQSIRDIEIVVVDDGSTDGTYALVTSMASADPRIKCVRMPKNVGVGAARNAALAAATGEWVTILDADDWYEPRRLEVMLKAAREHEADLVADNLQIYDHVCNSVVDRTHHGRRNKVAELTAEKFFAGDNPLRRHPTGFLQPMIRRQFIADHKVSYDPSYRVGEDFIFVAELLLQGARGFIVPDASYVYVHRISPTTRKISPHSHSEVAAVFSLFMRGCDALLEKYRAVISPGAKRALERRRWLFEKAVKYKEMRAALRQHKFFTATRIVLANPLILLLVAQIISGWVIANARFYIFVRHVSQ